MNYPIPEFVFVPNPQTMHTISIVSLIVGIFFIAIGLLFLFLKKRKAMWIFLCIGALLVVNHGIQLLL